LPWLNRVVVFNPFPSNKWGMELVLFNIDIPSPEVHSIAPICSLALLGLS
jgi:hypothetical protein